MVLPWYYAPSKCVFMLLCKDNFTFRLNSLRTEFTAAVTHLTDFIMAPHPGNVRCLPSANEILNTLLVP